MTSSSLVEDWFQAHLPKHAVEKALKLRNTKGSGSGGSSTGGNVGSLLGVLTADELSQVNLALSPVISPQMDRLVGSVSALDVISTLLHKVSSTLLNVEDR